MLWMPILALLPLASNAQPSDCVNYWTNPRTGTSECLDHGIAFNDGSTVRSGTAYLDRLKSCQPTVFSHPFPLNSDVTMRISIPGRTGDRCQVNYAFVPTKNVGKEWLFMRCRFSQATLAVLTDKQAYAEAKAMESGSFSFSTADPRQRVLSQKLSQECQNFDPPQ